MASALLLSLLLMTLSSSSHAFSAPQPITSDLAIVGCGVLGTSLCKQLLSHPDFASRSITGITKSTGRHDAIREQVLGGENDDVGQRFQVLTMEDVLSQYNGHSFKDVVFCAPPSGFDDYPSAVKEAATQLWSGSDSGGSFVFTSSGGVYEGADGEVVNESSPTSDPETNPRSARMVNAEKEAIALGGCALRLAGLYTLERGAHNYWLEKCSETGIQGREDGIVNLLNYDDAASAALAALRVGPSVNSKHTYLISDGNPTTRRGICESALKNERYAQFTAVPPFVGKADGPRGKVYDGSKSNEALRWKPRYSSFDEFMTM
eukprot:CAMPEP_0172313196 /NCGR_PEP_ID=MMETSP1058-20130122/19643_1 /TAXON_ID=83371 /ORGANISM="Detonula confervacea, Strain CCMP 353" /LENGTH=319 /DNA_ID=CAMNT_0013026809 /DNA_START=40 /DNA_END=999 /DNA_ORIENTATION=+